MAAYRLLIVTVGSIILLLCNCTQKRDISHASNGSLDLRNYDFVQDGPLRLDGQWKFYWNQLLGPDSEFPESSDVFNVPGSWNDFQSRSGKVPGEGYATFRLKIFLKPGSENLVLRIPHQGTAYSLYANGKLVRQNGKVGKSREEMIPAYVPGLTESFTVTELDLILQISNFYHRKGGPWGSILLGKQSDVEWIEKKQLAYELFLFGALLISALHHLGLFVVRRKDWSPLFFALFCFCVAIRTLLTGEKFFTQSLPELSWEFQLKLEYLSLFLSLPALFWFLYEIFPEEFHLRIRNAGIISGALFSIPVLFLPARYTSYLVQWYQVVILIGCIYLIYVLVMACVRGREGSVVFLVGAVIMIATVVNDILVTNFIIRSEFLFPFGFFVFIFSQSFLLSIRFSKAFSTVEILKEGLEDRVRERTAQLEEASRQKTAFFQNISHELRTPLTLIASPLENLRGKGQTPDGETSDLILRNTKRLQRLVNQLLDLQKITAGKMQLHPVSTDLGEFLRQITRTFGPYARGKGITLEEEIPANLRAVLADPDALEKCVSNYLSNALKFTPKSGIIRIRVSQEGKYTRIEVIDSGVGIEDAKLASLFTRFGHSETSLTREQEGTGLGLSLVRELVEIMGGEVGATSIKNSGSTFYFTLPQTEEPVVVATRNKTEIEFAGLALREIPHDANEGASEGLARAGKTVLVVDDNEDLRRYISHILSSEGYHIALAENGAIGLRKMIQLRPDLVVTDLMMPELSGTEMITQARLMKDIQSIPIVLLTARADAETRQEVRQAGADEYLAKPFSARELLDVTRNMFALKAKERWLLRDLEHARQIQEHLLPDRLPQKDGLGIAAIYEPTERVGGDLYDFVEFPDGRLGIFVADVSGHGLPAAMIASVSKILLSFCNKGVEEPGTVLRTLNQQLFGKTADYFLTGFFGILSPDLREFQFATAGHPPPLHFRQGNSSLLESRGRLMGLWPEADYETRSIQLEKGDRLILYTDGLTEASDADGVQFDSNGLTDSVLASSSVMLGVQLHQIIASVREFQGRSAFDDDVTLVGLEIRA